MKHTRTCSYANATNVVKSLYHCRKNQCKKNLLKHHRILQVLPWRLTCDNQLSAAGGHANTIACLTLVGASVFREDLVDLEAGNAILVEHTEVARRLNDSIFEIPGDVRSWNETIQSGGKLLTSLKIIPPRHTKIVKVATVAPYFHNIFFFINCFQFLMAFSFIKAHWLQVGFCFENVRNFYQEFLRPDRQILQGFLQTLPHFWLVFG